MKKMSVKLYTEIIELLVKTCGLDNMSIVHDGKITTYGTSTMDDDCNMLAAPIRNEKPNENRTEFNQYPMVLMYDGGFMYSIMSGEFGYSSRYRFEAKLSKLLKPYKMSYDHYDHISLVIYFD